MYSPKPLQLKLKLNIDFSDVPPDVLTFTITVMNRGRRAKDAEVAEVTVDMQALKSGTETEDWYHLTGVTPIGTQNVVNDVLIKSFTIITFSINYFTAKAAARKLFILQVTGVH